MMFESHPAGSTTGAARGSALRSEPESAALRAESVRAGYGRNRVIRDLSLSVAPGEVFALLGRNGSGKSTLVASLLGFRPTESGTLRVLGLDPWRHRSRLMRDVGFVPETPDAPNDATVHQLERFRSALYPDWDTETFRGRLDRFSISRRRRFGELSRGQKGLVEMALALAPSPRLLVFDDPTIGFDAVAKASFYEEMIDELSERGVTVFLTTHDLAEVERIADRIGILHEGQIVLDGAPDELKREHSKRSGGPRYGGATLEELLRYLTVSTEPAT
ncbi:MAG: hypothetical protein AMXMBFR36_35560 [Acidobacteriota bacterium]